MADQNTSHDNGIGWMILLVCFFCLFLIFWHFKEYDIKNIYRWIRWSEMYLLSFFYDDNHVTIWKTSEINFQEWFEVIPHVEKGDLDGQTLSVISTLAMKPLKGIFVAILTLMGFWCMFKGPGTQFRRKMGLNELITVQAATFPTIHPFIKFNPSDQPPRAPGTPVPAELPSFAEALGPEEWLAYNQIPAPDGRLDKNAVFMAFSLQLSKRWQGPMKLPAYKQIILAAFCLKAARKRSESDDILGRIAKCWSHENGLELKRDSTLVKEARKILRNKKLAGSTLSKANRHAFETTAMVRALLNARDEGGVLAPSQFVWLRAHDRTLWYPLNNLGRQSYHMEALGAMSHFKAERLTQRPIPKPKLHNAVDSLIDYMESGSARPIPALDYSKSKKRGVKKATK